MKTLLRQDRGSISLPCLVAAVVACMASMVVGHWIVDGPTVKAAPMLQRCIP